MEGEGRSWSVRGRPVDPMVALADAGCTLARIRVWTGDTGPNGLEDATETALRAQRAGLQPYVVLFLSDGWADVEKQPLSAAWAGLDQDGLVREVEAYTERVTRHLVDRGVDVDLVEIGNEIDFGVAGVFESSWPRRVSVPYLEAEVWPRMVPIVLAAERGVRRVRPEARFVLHLSQWARADTAVAFWRTMMAAGVQVDVAGLSYFPTAGDVGDLPSVVTRIRTEVGRPVLFAEYGYPAEAPVDGPFADWRHALPGHPLTPAGQRSWVRGFLRWARHTPGVMGAVYWSPEWYDSVVWTSFALFDPSGRARPALRALRAGRSR
jgi:arabinogalactan endo-1,4-beta-galactosidase